MNDSSSISEKMYLLWIAIILGLLAPVWLFGVGGYIEEELLKPNWEGWFGQEWFEGPDLLWLLALFASSLFPALIIGLVALSALYSYYMANFSTIHQKNLVELDRAKIALRQSLDSVEVIEREFKIKLESYEKVQRQLEELQSVKDLDTEELRKKLSAIEQATHSSILFQRLLGFLAGVASSLVAAYIWEVLNAA